MINILTTISSFFTNIIILFQFTALHFKSRYSFDVFVPEFKNLKRNKVVCKHNQIITIIIIHTEWLKRLLNHGSLPKINLSQIFFKFQIYYLN
jgi:hypothetical protein